MKKTLGAPGDERGYVMIVALLILALLTIIGVSSRKNSTTELMIATNEQTHKITFFEAEGGTELASELLEQNISCPNGFPAPEGQDFELTAGMGDEVMTVVVPEPSLAFWRFLEADAPSDQTRDIRIFHRPTFYTSEEARSRTNITVGGITSQSRGAALQIAAGYEGKGKGAAGGGANILYTINSQHLGASNAESIVRIKWRHNIGQEGDCLYEGEGETP
ncbi:MAG: hypothetical protein GY859_22365 [Desulfobacterales bacterium]|nr:hypothetical protein [Desulfobacterales bacterium]